MIWRYVGYALLGLALIASIVIGVKQCKQIDANQDNQLQNAGVYQERSQSQGEALNHVQEARNAVDAPTSNDLNSVCEKYDRNCKSGK